MARRHADDEPRDLAAINRLEPPSDLVYVPGKGEGRMLACGVRGQVDAT
jgi:hypothetical protein